MSESASAKAPLRDRLGPARAAFLFIDMQNDFASPKGKMAEFGFEIGCGAGLDRAHPAAAGGGPGERLPGHPHRA